MDLLDELKKLSLKWIKPASIMRCAEGWRLQFMQSHGRRLTSISGEHLVLDLLIATPKTKKALEDRLTVEWEGGPLKVVSPQGLILLKSFRNSGQDQDDIEYLRSLEDED